MWALEFFLRFASDHQSARSINFEVTNKLLQLGEFANTKFPNNEGQLYLFLTQLIYYLDKDYQKVLRKEICSK